MIIILYFNNNNKLDVIIIIIATINGSHLKCTLCVGHRSVFDTDVQRPKKTVFFCVFLTASRQKSIRQINTDQHRSVILQRSVGSKIGSDRSVHDAHFRTDFFIRLFYGKKSRRKVDRSITL